jgi:hypothetical protein
MSTSDRPLSFWLWLFCSLIVLAACSRKRSPETYFPETGRSAVYQNSLDLQSNLNVLSVALQPGYENLADLAYFRLGRGAAVKSAYLTNGESGASDVEGEYPHYLAARRRTEAARALSFLNGDVHFLNMPDIAAARDTASVRELWPSDTLQSRLRRVILQFKPEVILVARDWAVPGHSVRRQVMLAEVLTAVKSCAGLPPQNGTATHWAVHFVLADDWQAGGLSVPVTSQQPLWKKTYEEIAEDAQSAYASLSSQRRLWMKDAKSSYRLVYPATAVLTSLEEALHTPSSPRLRRMEEELLQLAAYTIENKTGGILKRIVGVMDSLDYLIAIRQSMTPRERKTLLYWKKELDELRCAMLGVEVDFIVSDTLLTDLQVTFLKVSEVKGLSPEGKTDIYFAPPEPGWGINEYIEQKLPLELNTDYRLLTPGNLTHFYPPGEREIQLSEPAKPLYFFIIHRAAARENSFVKRKTVNIVYAPKLVVENMTPIVRVISGERLVYRLMNVSRDGLADTLRVSEAMSFAFGHPFRLSSKGSSVRDTLHLGWEQALPEGSHLMSVQIGVTPVSRFVARKFSADIDHAKRVGLLTGITNSPVAETLRRLQIEFERVSIGRAISKHLEALSVLIVDQWALTQQPQLFEYREALQQFVSQGGHLIVLAQNALAWNASPLWDGLALTPTLEFEVNRPVEFDAGHRLMTSPNLISAGDWDEWLFQRAYHVVAGPAVSMAEVPVQAGGQPMIVTIRDGKGRKTYVDLALHPQLLNIHPGCFRLLANLISY